MKTSRILGTAQVALSVLFMSGYFAMLWLFLMGKVRTPVEWRDQLGILLGVLTAGVMMILQFWFSRSREQGTPEVPSEKGGL